jgi:threonine dehydratase
LTIDGGKTLAYEIISDLVRARGTLDRVFIQVGGGALASACVQAFEDAVRLGVLPRLPRLHAVQTARVHPLTRAYERLISRIRRHALPPVGGQGITDDEESATIIAEHAGSPAVADALTYAATHRSEFMWPWETEPQSIASGILDDETYDWLAVVRGMIRSGGYPVLVSEELLREANEAAVEATGIAVDETGSAGLAGLLAVQGRRGIGRSERVAVLFTGARR